MYGYIYKIENLVNGKIYIGQTTVKPDKRKWQHFNDLKNYNHRNMHLQRAYNKYGEPNFKFTLISWFNSQDELNKAEIYYIITYNCLDINEGYNIYPGGNNSKLPPETRLKLSIAHKGKILSEEHKLKISKATSGENNPMYGMKGELAPFYGRKHSPESIKKMSEAKKGYKHTSEARKNISKSKKGANHPFYGKHLPEITRLKISEAKKGKKRDPFSKEWRKNNSKALHGKGLFGFTSAILQKDKKPENKCWRTQIRYNKKRTSLGWFNDPLSCEIVYFFVWNEIYS